MHSMKQAKKLERERIEKEKKSALAAASTSSTSSTSTHKKKKKGVVIQKTTLDTSVAEVATTLSTPTLLTATPVAAAVLAPAATVVAPASTTKPKKEILVVEEKIVEPELEYEVVETVETFEYETVTANPVVLQKIRTDVFTEVQPIIHKQIEQEVVHHIDKHITEAPAARRTGGVKLAPKIIEHVHTRVIEEVTPIIHREVAVQKIEKVEEYSEEHLVAPAQHLHEVTYETAPGEVELHANKKGDTITAEPIIEERIREDVLVQVQPIIHREVHKTVINHVEKHITEAAAPSLSGRVLLAPKVEEQVHIHEVAEVQPVIHREKVEVTTNHVDEHITEHVTAPSAHKHEVVRESIDGMYYGVASREGDQIIKAPVIDEKVRTDTLVQVQPVIRRDVDQDVVRHIERHINEAPAPSLGGTVKLTPIVSEHVHTRIVNEVQPIVYREKAQQKVERVEEHLTEKVTAPAIHTHEVVNADASEKLKLKSSSADEHIAAPIIDEKIVTEVVTEVQPIVHKEIDQEVIHHIEKHITEAPAPSLAGKVLLAPKIEENVHTHTISEVQPIVHREKAVRLVENKEAHITEHVTAAPTHMYEKIKEKIEEVKINNDDLVVGVQAGGKIVESLPLPQQAMQAGGAPLL